MALAKAVPRPKRLRRRFFRNRAEIVLFSEAAPERKIQFPPFAKYRDYGKKRIGGGILQEKRRTEALPHHGQQGFRWNEQRPSLHFLVESAGNYFELLIFGKLIEIDRISAYTNGKRGIEGGIFHRIDQLLTIENVYVQMMGRL